MKQPLSAFQGLVLDFPRPLLSLRSCTPVLAQRQNDTPVVVVLTKLRGECLIFYADGSIRYASQEYTEREYHQVPHKGPFTVTFEVQP